jgi:uncharacterized protein (DUF779 family)
MTNMMKAAVVRGLGKPLRIEDVPVPEGGADHIHQPGGDESSPKCYPQRDFIIGDQDVQLGEIGGVPVYISASQYERGPRFAPFLDSVQFQASFI